ncbi:MAG: Transcription elongation factor GreA [Planctomycetes bacterium ADurb.Bin126]|nr:MAG: Transcription elongation factor GreA [Planctomycetes bacterium ADurb.Bin126]HOD83356.1 GreA/GreB family elongation factor [Phycisphaerae bacterium]HQL76104.1 GreA/GreB family elongation factor [Phycisphaerae bacterium]
MNVTQITEWIAAGEWTAVESAWLAAVEQEKELPAEQVSQVLEALAAAKREDLAETLAWTLLADRSESAEPEAALVLAQAAALIVPAAVEVRNQIRELYRQLHAGRDEIEPLLAASGLVGNQSPRRAFRTLDVCLALKQGDYLANRFDHRVIRIDRFEPIMSEFHVRDEDGRPLTLEPKALADEFQPVEEHDFRVLSRRGQEEVAKALQDDPANVLIGMCLSRDGRIDSTEIKDLLVPDFLPADKWSGWWNRARTAAKRCEQLTLEGRNPILVVHHPGGRTLEEEMAERIASARTPTEHLAALRDYVRETRVRQLQVDSAIAGQIVSSLADQARSFLHKRPADALAAALAVQEAAGLGLTAPADAPTPLQVLDRILNRPQALARLDDPTLWEPALDALVQREDPQADLEALLYLAQADQLDAVVARLKAAGGESAIQAAADKAVAEPADNLELSLWLWQAQPETLASQPPKLELLSRLLKALQDIEHNWEIPQSHKKTSQRRIRAALSARDYASYRQAVSEMSEAVAGIMKGRIERAEGLAETVRDEMLGVLREKYFSLFAKARISPWLDETALWTTEKAFHRRQDELKELTEVKMLANAKAIGAAAELGDLSENSEFKYALEQRDILRGQAAKMMDELAKARVILRENVPADSVGIGSKVTLRRVDDHQEVEMSFLGPWDSDLSARVYSYQTPLAQSMMGKRVGDEVSLKVDGGEDRTYRIEKVDSAL